MMPTVLLVRHGQASFGEPVYDRLSEKGGRQAKALGAYFKEHLPREPERIIAGSLDRQTRTAQLVREAASWQTRVTTDERWNEYDGDYLAHLGGPSTDASWPIDYQSRLEGGMQLWASEEQHRDSYSDFCRRTWEALSELTALTGTSVVFSSGGVISHLATTLIDGTTKTWVKLCRVAANTGVTTIAAGKKGVNLVSFNQTAHSDGALLTYR